MTLILAQFIRKTAVKATDWLIFILVAPIVIVTFLIISKGLDEKNDK